MRWRRSAGTPRKDKSTASTTGEGRAGQEPELRVPVCLRLRQALAVPIYVISLILDFASVALGCLAALVAGDWPS